MNKRKGNQIGVFGMEIGFFDSLVIDQHFGDSTIDVTIKKSVFQKISVSKNFGFISTAAKLNIFLVLNFGSSLLIQFILNVPKSQSQYWMKMTTSPMYLSHLPSLICQFQILVCTFYIKCPRASLWFNGSGNRFLQSIDRNIRSFELIFFQVGLKKMGLLACTLHMSVQKIWILLALRFVTNYCPPSL